MTEAFLRGMDKEQENVIDVINVIDKNIAPCKGCFGCWQKKDGHCVIQDDQNEILDLYVKAGVEYAAKLKLSDETKKVLETPMISKEEYLRGING